jgi:hypothetical protein
MYRLFPKMAIKNGLSRPGRSGVTQFGKLNHSGPWAENWLGWSLATARLTGFRPKVTPVATLAQHLDLTLVELLTLSLAVLNGVMYFLWWNKPLDVRCPVRVSLIGDHSESIFPQESFWEEGKLY